MSRLILMFAMVFSMQAFAAAPETPSPSGLKTLAEEEVKRPNVSGVSSEALATVRVNLAPILVKQNISWGLSLGMTRFQVSGQPDLEFIQPQDLSTTPALSLWYLQFRRHHRIENWHRFKSWFVSGDVGGGASEPNATTESGFTIEDIRIQAFRSRLNAGVEWQISDSSFSILPQVTYGVLNLSQVSSNTAARFSETQSLYGGSLFLQWAFLETGMARVGYEVNEYLNSSLARGDKQALVFEVGYQL